MKRNVTLVVVMSIFLTIWASTAWAAPRVAVMDFDNKTQYGGWRLGHGAADILTTELVKINKFEMFERDRLQAVLKEQNLGASGRVDPSTAARIGKIIGVSYIITGSVTEYGQSRTGGGGGGIHVGKTDYAATVDVRIVDATTGRILFADTGSGQKSSMNVKVFGFGGGQSFNEKAATEALRIAVKDLANKIAALNLQKRAAGQTGVPTAKALVADVDGTVITINKGSNAGFKADQTLTIKRKGKVIKDPTTGKILKVKYRMVGKIKLTQVESSYAEGNVISGSGFKVGDRVD